MRNYDRGQQNNGKLVILKPVDWEYNGDERVLIDQPYFQELEKLPDASGKLVWQVVKGPKPLSSITADLVGVKVVEEKKEVKGKLRTFKSVKVTLRDEAANETYAMDVNWRVATRNLFNSLAGLQTFENVEINYYRNKSKVPGKPGFETFSVKQNGEFVNGPYTWEEMQAMTSKVEINGEVQTDSGKLQKALTEKLNDLSTRIQASKSGGQVQSAAPQFVSTEVEEDIEPPF